MHLVGSIMRIYHDARSPERQTRLVTIAMPALTTAGEHRLLLL